MTNVDKGYQLSTFTKSREIRSECHFDLIGENQLNQKDFGHIFIWPKLIPGSDVERAYKIAASNLTCHILVMTIYSVYCGNVHIDSWKSECQARRYIPTR